MKTFIRIDFLLQSVLLFTAGFALIAMLAVTSDFLLLLLVAQFAMGVLQMFTATVHVFSSSAERKLRMIHFVFAGIYLIAFFVFTPSEGTALFVLANATAWLLAILYYVITWRLNFVRKTSGSGFLPHLSF